MSELKARIRAARLRAALSLNQELIELYWNIGQEILKRQDEEGWGAKVIDRLARDLRRDFPEMTGLSSRNLKYMRALADTYPDEAFVQQVVARLPWGYNVRLIEAVKSPVERHWYARQAIEHGWSCNVLVHQIDSQLYLRQGKALTNFAVTLPSDHSELAQQLIKDPYQFDFLSLGADMSMEWQLVENSQRVDVHPYEEAQGFQRVLDLPGYDVTTLVEKFGKSASHIYARLSLLQLLPTVAEAFVQERITASHANLIARLPQEHQADAFEQCWRKDWNDKEPHLLPAKHLSFTETGHFPSTRRYSAQRPII